MDEESKRMEEGLNSPLNNDDGNKDDLKKQETVKTIIEHDKDTLMAKPVPESVQQIAQQEQPLVKHKTKRVATLDAFRGLTIVLMILVDDAGEAYPRIDHSPWNGCTLADFVMPFFLFIVGVAIALALKKIPKIKHAVKKIILRTLKLLFWGIILQGGYSHAPDALEYGVNMKFIRWFGILQRIALVYCVVALIETFTTKLRPTTFGGFVAFLIYMITTFTLYVPDWSFVDRFNDDQPKRYTVYSHICRAFLCSILGIVICGMRGHLGPACNAVGHVDRQVWGVNHLYSQPVWRRLKACTLNSPGGGPFREDAPSWCPAPFEPEGLLSYPLRHYRGPLWARLDSLQGYKTSPGHSERLKQWVSMGFVLLTIAIILHFTDALPINKQLYSFSYVCFTAGAAGIVFSGFYILIDVWGFRTPFLFLEWIGMNAMLVFVMAAQGIFAAFVNGWYYEDPRNSLVHWIKKHVFVNVWHSERVGTILYVIFAEITFWGVVAGVLHKLRIYWKL
ncbi:Heparan-alpha-glucosaminide N-acetyltransferase, partial [Mucuna pruriens]